MWYAISICSHCLSTYVCYKRGSQRPRQVVDIGVELIPDLSRYRSITVVADALVLLPPLLLTRQQLGEYMEYASLIILIRSVFICLTILPAQKPTRQERFRWLQLLRGHAHDKIFSGHSALFFLGMSFLKHKFIRLMLMMSYSWLIISIRYHYTADIAVAGLVTYLVVS